MTTARTTDIAVVLATRNRAESLRQTLQSIGAMDAAGLDWQLWVADNGSEDHTASVLSDFRDRLPLHVLHAPEPGKNRALNRVLDGLNARLIVFTDDDVEVVPGWLRAFVDAAADQPEHDIFAGRILPRFPPGAPGWMTNPAYHFSRAAFARFDLGETSGPTQRDAYGPSFAVRGRCLAGRRYDENIGPGGRKQYVCGGETELLRRLRATGAETYYVAPALVWHQVREEQLSLAWLQVRAFRLGRGDTYIRTRQVGAMSQSVFRRIRWSLPWAWLRWKLASWFAGPVTVAKRAETYHFRRGQLAEWAAQRAE
ncbi:MAG: glycosyltransferase family 2 protein [Abyssibacter sp.]|uniref:glycosyltransferase n=1 Tax=Abyssibacter sp. TaxID=2320200 RepID=UPI00321BB5DC